MIDYKDIFSTEQYEELTSGNNSGIFYFTQSTCNVGESVKDKVLELVDENFPSLDCYYINTDLLPDLAGQNSIFAYPTILVFLDGQEFFRFSRNISIRDMKDKISRPYNMLFE